jgi:hypothetical protein
LLDVAGTPYCITCVAERMRSPMDPIRFSGNLLFVLSFVPGLGHLYLGFRQRGLQLALLWLVPGWLSGLLFWQEAFGLVTALAVVYSIFEARELYQNMQQGVSVGDQPLTLYARVQGWLLGNPRAAAGLVTALGVLLLVRVATVPLLEILGVAPDLLDRLRLLLGPVVFALTLVIAGIGLWRRSVRRTPG